MLFELYCLKGDKKEKGVPEPGRRGCGTSRCKGRGRTSRACSRTGGTPCLTGSSALIYVKSAGMLTEIVDRLDEFFGFVLLQVQNLVREKDSI